MTKRTPVTSQSNIWFDSEQVDDSDLTLEQDHNDTVQSGIINNHIGTGILPEVLVQNIIFDSLLAAGNLDGVPVSVQNQPNDNNFGNQLEINLTNSEVGSKKSIKLAIIGLDFNSNLQYETFYFKTNEIQVTRKHYTKILVLLFNDFIGNPNLSFNLGGRLVIKETNPMTLSRQPVMIAQDVEPNLFFRDFFVDGFISLQALLQASLPLYNIDSLNIMTAQADQKILMSGDVVTQIGQKFQASTNNIQKIQLLLAVQNLEAGHTADLVWEGDLIISIYPLQSTIDCPSDIAPNTALDFQPLNIPLAQLSFNYLSLQSGGTVLNSVPQPVDFVFSNSFVAGGTNITIGNYYAFTIKRAGSANKCDILISTGTDQLSNSRITTFTGTVWVDLPDEDLWFRIWTDAAKVSDGQAYDTGHGVILPKIIQDPVSLSNVDYSLENLQFVGNDVFRAVLSAQVNETTPIPDQRTGNPVLSRQEFVPNIQLLNTIDITNLEQASEPLLLGAISDKNIKFFDSTSSILNSKLYSSTFVNDELIIRIVDDPTDSIRFDTSVTSLISDLLNGYFVGGQISPNGYNVTTNYRIASAVLASGIVGDVNGDGIIDINDLNLLTSYYGFNMNLGLPVNSIITTDGYHTTFTNGYNTYIKNFTNLFNLSFQLVDPSTNAVIASASDGILVANPNDPTLAQFTSSIVNFNNFTGISSYKLIVIIPSNQEDNGGFNIIGLDTVSDVITIQKIFLNGDVMMNMLRADIDGDFEITTNDGYLLQSYIDRLTSAGSSFVSPYPGPSSDPFSKIGTRFNSIRLRLEQFIDREDDYYSAGERSETVHTAPDIFLNDGYFTQHNFYTSPVPIVIDKQLTWDESLIVTNSQIKLVPSVFTSESGDIENSCILEGVNVNIYGSQPDFDKGTVDFFAPDNLILGGEIERPDGNFYKVDFEVGTIVLEVPDGLFGSERTINIMDDFIADYTGDGRTRLGFPSMRYADCSFVQSGDLTADKIRFSVAVQSFSPNTNGLSTDGYAGIIVDGKMGISIDYMTGLLTLNFTNLYQDAILKTLSTKVQVHVYLKKAGFNNSTLFVDSVKVQNMLKLISVFSGPNDGGPSSLVDLTSEVTGILPIINGGTGLGILGASGMVLVSNGTGLSYRFLTATDITYSAGTPSNWTATAPATVQAAIDRMAALLFTHYGAIP